MRTPCGGGFVSVGVGLVVVVFAPCGNGGFAAAAGYCKGLMAEEKTASCEAGEEDSNLEEKGINASQT